MPRELLTNSPISASITAVAALGTSLAKREFSHRLGMAVNLNNLSCSAYARIVPVGGCSFFLWLPVGLPLFILGAFTSTSPRAVQLVVDLSSFGFQLACLSSYLEHLHPLLQKQPMARSCLRICPSSVSWVCCLPHPRFLVHIQLYFTRALCLFPRY